MKAPGIVILLFGLVVLAGGIIGYTTAGSMASLMAGSAFGLGLLLSGLGVLRARKPALLVAPLLTLLLTAFFTYRFVQSGVFMPSGLTGVLGLVALALYFALRR